VSFGHVLVVGGVGIFFFDHESQAQPSMGCMGYMCSVVFFFEISEVYLSSQSRIVR
jgi:hypothetical protein